ncbi:MAG TPA: hypothetical protein VN922_08045 [Bacteroidia bacterium]|nr:hypothetical protein [Bacteroidia bacterium]
MKPLLIIFISLSFALTAFGQQPEYPDSGFTNKAEAKNLTINGLKEGKWVDYLKGDGENIYKGSYRLMVYKEGQPYGIMRQYYYGNNLYLEVPFTNGEWNGVVKEYDWHGKLKSETTYNNGVIYGTTKLYEYVGKGKSENVTVKEYDRNGNLLSETTYNNGKVISTKEYNEKGDIMHMNKDTLNQLHRMIIGTWVDVVSPNNIWSISTDSIRNSNCWTDYFINLENVTSNKETVTYWFGIDYLKCGEKDNTNREYFGNISINDTYMSFHDFDSETTFVFKKKQ